MNAFFAILIKYDADRCLICASGSAVEHNLAKVGVAGSIPVSRSLKTSENTDFTAFSLVLFCVILNHFESQKY